MRKLWNNIIHIVLALLVIFSLVVFANIVHPSYALLSRLPSGQVKSSDQQNVQTPTHGSSSDQNSFLDKIFTPHRLIYSDKGKYYESGSVDLILGIDQRFKDLLPHELENGLQTVSEEEWESANADDKQRVDLYFSDQLLFGALDLEDVDVSEADAEKSFNRITYVFGQNKLYFVDDKQHKAYSINLTGEMNDPGDLLDQYKGTLIECQPVQFKDRSYYLTTAPMEMTCKVYLLERPSNSYYLQLLFNDMGEIRDYSDVDFSRFYASDRSLVVNNATFEAEFSFDQSIENRESNDELLFQSYQDIQDLQINPNNWLYFSQNPDNDSITYRRYVDGYPVFGEDYVSRIRFSVDPNDRSRLQFSALEIQTPITNLEEQMSLPSGMDVLQILNENGYPTDQIEDLQLGYYWVQSNENNRLINLVPTWVVKWEGSYYVLDSLVDMSRYPNQRTKNLDTGEDVLIKETNRDKPTESQDEETETHEVNDSRDGEEQ